MSEALTSTKLDPDTHLMIDQPLLRLPNELLRKNLKAAQRQIEITNKSISTALQASATQSPVETLASLDATLAKAQSLKRKLEDLHNEEKALHEQQKARIRHLEDLHNIPSLADVKYTNWSRTRLERILVDYLCRAGLIDTAKKLTSETDISRLVDIEVFEECHEIEASLLKSSLQKCLSWCERHKQALKKTDSTLELELRFQQFVEMVKEGHRDGTMTKRLEAMMHARKHFMAASDPSFALKAAGLLAQPADTTVERYRSCFDESRYNYLANLFVRTHHELYALPDTPLIHIALNAGLSALKTPACHSAHALKPSTLTGAPVCPICSTELNELARAIPYAHHTKSYMEEDPVVLPTGRVFGRERLKGLLEKVGVDEGWVRDPTDKDGDVWKWDESTVRKVFIS